MEIIQVTKEQRFIVAKIFAGFVFHRGNDEEGHFIKCPSGTVLNQIKQFIK